MIFQLKHNNAINPDAKKLRRSYLAMQLFSSGYGWRWASSSPVQPSFSILEKAMLNKTTILAVAATLIAFPVVGVSQDSGKPNVPGGIQNPPVIINPLPPFPTSPDGPIWMPAPRSEYRVDLERFREELETYRQANPVANMGEYQHGLEKYRGGIRLYRENGATNSISPSR